MKSASVCIGFIGTLRVALPLLLECVTLLLPLRPAGAQVSGDAGIPGSPLPPGPHGGPEGDPTCRLSKPWFICCGPLEYNQFNDTCCGGFLVVGRPFAACCGRDAFNADVQGCCNGRVVSRSSNWAPLACCGTVGYDPTSFECCGSTVVRSSPVTACCGGQAYFTPEPIGPTGPTGIPGPMMIKGDVGYPADSSPGSPSTSSRAVCCGCKLYTVKGYRGRGACCGDVPYDTATQMCCNGALHSTVGKRSPTCCGTVLLDLASNIGCCQGRPFTRGVFGPLCCPDGTLNSCCFDPVHNVTACI